MGQIGPGGSFQQPFQPKRDALLGQNTASNVSSNTGNLSANTASGLPAFLDPKTIQLLGELLLAPLAGQGSALSSLQLSLLLKGLLHLPGELQQLLAEVLTSETGPQAQQLLQQLLKDNPELALNLSDLQTVLQEAVQKNEKKLLQLLQSGNQSLSSGSQSMGELLSTMSGLSSKLSGTPTQALNTTLLLYLPWYPLAAQQKLTLHFEMPGKKGDGDGEDEGADNPDNAHLVMLIDTNRLGRFKITTLIVERTQLMFHIEHDAAALPVKQSIQHNAMQALQKSGLPPEFEWKQRNVSPRLFNEQGTPFAGAGQADDVRERADKQSVAVHNVGQVPVSAVQGAYWLARLIFEADNQSMGETSEENPS